MINFDDYANENKTSHNQKWPYIPNNPQRILIIGGSGSGKTNAFLNLITNQPDIDRICLYAKDPYETKYQYLINKREKVGLIITMIQKFSLSIQMMCKMFTKILMNTIQIKNTIEHNSFDDMIADMINNKKLNLIQTELFI